MAYQHKRTPVTADEPRPEAVSAYGDFAEDCARTAAAYDLRVEEDEEGPLKDTYLAHVDTERKKLALWGARAESLWRRLSTEQGVRRLIAYSGLIGMTSAAGQSARRVGWDVVFCESWAIKPGHMICNLNAPSLVCSIRGWLQSLGQWDHVRAKEIDKLLAFQEAGDTTDAEWLKGCHQFQRSSARDGLAPRLEAFLSGDEPTFLLAPNVVGDSATLRSRTIFLSQRRWITEVCEFFKACPEWKLVVRAHPDEHFMAHKVKVPMGEVAEKAAQGASNIHVIKGSEDTSTYALIPRVRGGLIWMSTVGVDMVVRDCPVVAAARPKYSGLGIVVEPASREAYFEAIERMAVSPSATSDMQKTTAKKYLAILAQEFSYQAFSPQYRGQDIHLNGHPAGGDCETFYRILAGDLPTETRPPARDSSKGER